MDNNRFAEVGMFVALHAFLMRGDGSKSDRQKAIKDAVQVGKDLAAELSPPHERDDQQG